MNELGNLNIVGTSSVSGGSYANVRIMGVLTVLGDLDAAKIKVVGSMSSRNAINCDKIKVMGNAGVGNLKINQSGLVIGVLDAQNIVSEQFEVLGVVNCEEAFESGSLTVSGAMTVEGLLNVEAVVIKSRHTSRIKEMGGKTIKVSPAFATIKHILKTETIEFDEVDLEWTKAELVRGRNVTIGANCVIDVVEYTDNLIHHPGARIGEVRKV